MNFPLTNEQIISILNDNYDIMDSDLWDKLYEYYLPDMPYGTAKARDGDPAEWIYERLWEEYEYLLEG